MFMKHFLLFLFFSSALIWNTKAAVVSAEKGAPVPPAVKQIQEVSTDLAQLTLDEFLTLTPAKYREMTGKRLGLKKSIQLKAAQKALKKELRKDEPDISKGVYVLLAILGLGWLAMGLLDNWDGSDWLVNLLLTVLCWLPGLIHALVKMKKYYP